MLNFCLIERSFNNLVVVTVLSRKVPEGRIRGLQNGLETISNVTASWCTLVRGQKHVLGTSACYLLHLR